MRQRIPCLTEVTLPDKLRARSSNGWIAVAADDPEVPAADVPARIVELRVVEDVEEFSSNLEGHRFSDDGPLREPEIGIVETWAVEEPAVGGPESSAVGARKRGRTERTTGRGECARQEIASRARARNRRVKCGTSGIHFTRIHSHHRPHAIRHIRATTGKRRIPGALAELDGKPSGQASDSLHLPALRQSFRRAFEGPVERDSPNVAGYEIVGYVG